MNEIQQREEHGPLGPREGVQRRRYQPPIIESGEAFERVQLASGCDSGIFDGCEVPCDA